MKEKKIDKVIEAFRNYRILKEEGMGVSSLGGGPTNRTNSMDPQKINIAGLPPDNPPVDLRKDRRKYWNPFFKNLARMQRRKPPQ